MLSIAKYASKNSCFPSLLLSGFVSCFDPFELFDPFGVILQESTQVIGIKNQMSGLKIKCAVKNQVKRLKNQAIGAKSELISLTTTIQNIQIVRSELLTKRLTSVLITMNKQCSLKNHENTSDLAMHLIEGDSGAI